MRETDANEALKILLNGVPLARRGPRTLSSGLAPYTAVTVNIVSSNRLPEPTVFLSPTEIKRYNSFKIPKRKADWLGGRYAAKILLASMTRRKDLSNIEISYDDYGRPRAAGLAISISHSGGLALAAVKPGGADFIGADIELVEVRAAAWYADYFTSEELSPPSASEIQNNQSYATKLWTIKEAALKALGLGLKADLRDVRFETGALRFSGAALARYRELGSPAFSVSSFLLQNVFWITAVSN